MIFEKQPYALTEIHNSDCRNYKIILGCNGYSCYFNDGDGKGYRAIYESLSFASCVEKCKEHKAQSDKTTVRDLCWEVKDTCYGNHTTTCGKYTIRLNRDLTADCYVLYNNQYCSTGKRYTCLSDAIVYCDDHNKMSRQPKQPIGIKPRSLFEEDLNAMFKQRRIDLLAAITRHVEADKLVPSEWLDELREL